jgi:type II secretory pathway predicted ATPase ExeA
MYEACFGLQRRPFAPAPDVNQYFPGEAIENARQTLARCVLRAEGAAMVVGPSGTGKTLLCRVLAEQFRGSLAVALLCSGRLSTRSALYQAILYELGRPYRGMDEGELRLALVDYLTTCEQRPDGLVLLVDEAHTLSLRLLDEIRMLTNLVGNGQARVRVVLVGGPVLEERFASPKLESFAQRLVVRCYLESFSRAETQQYVRAQIDAAGGQGLTTFATEATEAVHKATDGVPRLINQVCDHALLLACTDGQTRIDAKRVEEAWADLQQLPSPWNGDEKNGMERPSVIEFGRLDDEPPLGLHAPPTSSTSPALRLTPSDADEEPAERLHEIELALADLSESKQATDGDEGFQPAGTIGPELDVVFDDWIDPFGEHFENEEVVVDRYAPPAAPEPPQADVVHPKPAKTSPAAVASVETTSPSASRPDTVPMRRPEAASGEPSDEDMIVIEEGYDADRPPAGHGVVVAKRHEYRQLFAKLRQA